MQNPILILAQGFGLGRIPVAPGTFGSLAGLLWLMLLLETGNLVLFFVGLISGVFLSVWICGSGEKILKQRDPSSIVFDEIIAVPIGFLPWILSETLRRDAMPASSFLWEGRGWIATILLFVSFRVFDIAKPWPVGASQKMHGGWGVTVDDVLAATYVSLVSLPFVL